MPILDTEHARAETGLLSLMGGARLDRPSSQLAAGIVVAAGATGLRWTLGFIVPGILPFALYFPGLIVISFVGGWRAGAVTGVAAVVTGWYMFLQPVHGFAVRDLAAGLNLFLFVGMVSGVVALGAYMRSVVRRLEHSRKAIVDQNLNYNILFETMSEGFVLCETIRDEPGQLVDYAILEINPALQLILGLGPEAVGKRLSQTPGEWAAWLALCDRVLRNKEPLKLEHCFEQNAHWYEIRINPVTDDRLALLYIDITDQKRSEAYQAELFSELNHRIMNNLALVAGFLNLQARGAQSTLRDELHKAAARVQGIAEVHTALYRGSRRNEVDFGAYLRDLCASLARTLVDDERVAIVVDAEPAVLPIDIAVPLGMVVNELVTNAVKYAYPRPGRGVISVWFGRVGAALVLRVTDNGAGLPDESAARPGSLGMSLVQSLVAQVQGDLVTHPGPGARFEISLPAPAVEAASRGV